MKRTGVYETFRAGCWSGVIAGAVGISAAQEPVVIAIDGNVTHQTMFGFGATTTASMSGFTDYLGRQYNLPVGMTEVSYGGVSTLSYDDFRGRAIHIHDELVYAGLRLTSA